MPPVYHPESSPLMMMMMKMMTVVFGYRSMQGSQAVGSGLSVFMETSSPSVQEWELSCSMTCVLASTWSQLWTGEVAFIIYTVHTLVHNASISFLNHLYRRIYFKEHCCNLCCLCFSGRAVVLKSTKGWVSADDQYHDVFHNVEYTPAIYTHCYDWSGMRLFTAGGPLPASLKGNYAALWCWGLSL